MKKTTCFLWRITKISALLISALILVGCKSSSVAPAGEKAKPIVYTSFYPIHELAAQIAGERLDIRTFMPLDKDPHHWEPTPKDMAQLAEADLLIVNGANMERWLDQVRTSIPNLEVLVLSDAVELITYKGAAAIGDFQFMAKTNYQTKKYAIEFGHTHEDLIRVAFYKNEKNLPEKELIEIGKKIMEKKAPVVLQHSTFDVESEKVYAIEMGHESGKVYYQIPAEGEWIIYSDRISEEILSYVFLDAEEKDLLPIHVLLEGSTSGFDKITYDPHSWMSIINAKKYLNQIQTTFLEKFPGNDRAFKKNKLKAVTALTDLEFEYKEKFKNIEIREFIVTHHAYAYLARDFQLNQFALQGLISTESPSLKTIRKALEFCQHYHIKIIFYEYGAEKKGADTLSSELGGETLPLASMEYVTRLQTQNGATYLSLMRMNLENLYQSLKGNKNNDQ